MGRERYALDFREIAEVLPLLARRRYDVVHYAGHAFFEETTIAS